MTLLLSFLLLFSTVATASSHYPSLGQTVSSGATDVQYMGSFFMTTGVYDVDGKLESLQDKESYQLFQSDVLIRYGYSDLIEFGGGVRFRFIQTGFVDTATGDDLSVSKSGAESYFINLKYALMKDKKTNWVIDGLVRQSAYDNTSFSDLSLVAADEVVLGDSGSSIELGVGGDYRFTQDRLVHGRLAYHKPGNSLSEEVIYKLEHIWRGQKWDISAGAYGIYSMQSDAYQANPSNKPIQERSPSGLFNSINRSSLNAGAGLGYLMGKWRLDAGYQRVLSGTSTDQGHLVTFGLTRLGKRKRDKNSMNKKDRFKEYTIEADVVKVSNRGRFIRIDKGVSSGVAKGMRFDLYNTDFSGNNLLIAEAVAYKVGATSSILKVVNRFSRKPVEVGFTARAR